MVAGKANYCKKSKSRIKENRFRYSVQSGDLEVRYGSSITPMLSVMEAAIKSAKSVKCRTGSMRRKSMKSFPESKKVHWQDLVSVQTCQ